MAAPVWRGLRWLLFAAAALGLAISVFDYFWPDNGIHGSLGVLIVIGSTALMAIAAAAIASGLARGWLRAILAALILLDILGTGFAAYMLEAEILFGLMVLALIVWLAGVFAPATPRIRLERAEAAS